MCRPSNKRSGLSWIYSTSASYRKGRSHEIQLAYRVTAVVARRRNVRRRSLGLAPAPRPPADSLECPRRSGWMGQQVHGTVVRSAPGGRYVSAAAARAAHRSGQSELREFPEGVWDHSNRIHHLYDGGLRG